MTNIGKFLSCGKGVKSKKAIARLTGIPRATVRDCIKRYGRVVSLNEVFNEQPQTVLLSILKSDLNAAREEVFQNYAYLLGIYSGDGSISKVRNVYRLRVRLDAKYPAITDKCVKTLQVLLPQNAVGIQEYFYQDRLSCVDVSSYYSL